MRPLTLDRRESTTPPPDAWVARLAARQHGVVTLAQLRASGLDHHAVARRAKHGRLHRIHRGVYAVGHDGLSREGRWLAAVFAAGEGSGLSHESGAELLQVWRRRAVLDHVVAPRRRTVSGAQIHRCNRLDITSCNRIPVTTVARLLVDVLTAHQITYVISEAAFRKRFSLEATRSAIQRSNGRHDLEVLERALHLYEHGSAGTKSDRSSTSRCTTRRSTSTGRTAS